MQSECFKCGFTNPPGLRFCGNCGAALSGAPGQLRTDSTSLRPQVSSQLEKGSLTAGDVKLEGERRNVTVLFADLSDYTVLAGKMEDEALYEMLGLFLRMLVEKVNLYEGTVDKIIGDGVMALFGVPAAQENAPERAVRSAMDMLSGLQALNRDLRARFGEELLMHVGIHTGSVILGGVETKSLVDYTAIGDTVNIARRLQESAAPGTILVSDRVFRATKSIFNYSHLPSLRVKGIPQPLDTYRLEGFKELPSKRRGIEGLYSPMIGRRDELGYLLQSVADLRKDRRGRLIVVTGEAGIGKSRLIEEFKERITGLDITLLEGHSLTYRRSASYWMFQDLVRNILKVTYNTPKAQIKERLAAKTVELFGESDTDSLPFLENLLSLELDESRGAQRLMLLEAEQLRQHTFLAVRDLLKMEARRKPLVVILEDLHWADEVSLDLLRFLIQEIDDTPILLLSVSRPLEEGRLAAIVDLGRKRLGDRCSVLELSGLDEDQCAELLGHLLGTDALSSRLRGPIVSRSAGIPFYIEEILRMLIDRQLLYQSEGQWRLANDFERAGLSIPETLQDLMMARIDRLDPDQRLVLQIASVIGRQFNLDLLELALKNFEIKQLDLVVAGLVEKAFILPLSSDDREYIFRHVLTSDAIYRTLLRRDLSKFHTLVGEALESLYSDELENHVEILASHFLRSSRLDKALHYLILAGEKSAGDYANDQANRHFSEARHLLSLVEHTPEQALRVLVGLGDVFTFTGEYEAARESYREALQVIESTQPFADVKRHSAVHRKIGTTYERQGDFDRALEHLVEASKALGKTAFLAPGSKAEILNDLGWIYFLRGNFEEAQKNLMIGLSLVEGTSDYRIVASIHNRLGAVAYQKRDYEEAASHVRKSLALREMIGDLSGVARLYNNLGLLSLMAGDLREAEENFHRSSELLEKLGDAEGIALTNINIGLVKCDRGHFEAARMFLEKARAVADQIGHRFYLALSSLYLGRLNTCSQQYAEAARLLSASLALFDELGALDHRIDGMGYLAENCLAWGDSEGALRWSQTMTEAIANAQGVSSITSLQKGRLLRTQGRIARLRRDYELAQQLLTEAFEMFHTSKEKLESGRTFYELGLLARDQGKHHQSQQMLLEARLLFQEIGAEHDLSITEEALNTPALAGSSAVYKAA